MAVEMRSSGARTLSSPPLVRMAHLMAFSGFLFDEGVPVDKMLSRAGLPTLCDEKDCFVPVTRVWSFFDDAAGSTDPGLGWLVGKYVGDHNLNIALREQLENAPSLYQALYGLVEKVRSEASHLQLGIYERADDVLIYTCYPGLEEMPGYHQSQSYQLGVFFGLIRNFLGRYWSPEVVGVQAQRTPPGIDKQFPDSKMLVGRPMGYLAIARARLHETIAHCGSRSPEDTALPPNRDFTFEATLRELLRSYLFDGYPSSAMAADLMNMSERTLARRLSRCGLTYGELVDEVRFRVAKKLLRKPGAKIGDVAMQVGFDDQSNFTRMFRRIGGLSPREYRNSVLQ